MIAHCSKYLLSLCLFLVTLPMTAYSATAELYTNGKDFITLPTQLRDNQDIAQLLAEDPNKVQVLFFFSYGCSACARFDPDFEQWVKKQKSNKKLVIHRFPVSFDEEWKHLAKLYYIMKTLDPNGTLDAKIFAAIHDQNLQLWQESVMKEFFVNNGYSAESFDKTFDSFQVNMEVKKADQISSAYGISQTPTIVVNNAKNSYKLNKHANDLNTYFKVLDYLVAQQK